MTSYNLLYFLYGASIMFHLMMALLFSYKRRASLNIYVSTLMLVTAAQYAKNLALIGDGCYDSALESLFSSSIDLFTMPLYAIVLIEACRPGWLNWWRASLLYLPFLVLMTVSLAYPEPLVFDVIHISSFVCCILELVAMRSAPLRAYVDGGVLLREIHQLQLVARHYRVVLLHSFAVDIRQCEPQLRE